MWVSVTTTRSLRSIDGFVKFERFKQEPEARLGHSGRRKPSTVPGKPACDPRPVSSEEGRRSLNVTASQSPAHRGGRSAPATRFRPGEGRPLLFFAGPRGAGGCASRRLGPAEERRCEDGHRRDSRPLRGSTRFPGKPLAPLLGAPMVARTSREGGRARPNASTGSSSRRTIRADCRGRRGPRGWRRSRSPSADHATGTDRVAEVGRRGRLRTLVINLQGDVPLLEPHDDRRARRRRPSTTPRSEMATLGVRGRDPPRSSSNPRAAKIVVDDAAARRSVLLARADSVPSR